MYDYIQNSQKLQNVQDAEQERVGDDEEVRKEEKKQET